MKKYLIGTAAVLMLSATAFADDGGSGSRGLDITRDSFPGLGAMRPDQGTVIQPSGEIIGLGELNAPGNGGTYPNAGPSAYVPGWKPYK